MPNADRLIRFLEIVDVNTKAGRQGRQFTAHLYEATHEGLGVFLVHEILTVHSVMPVFDQSVIVIAAGKEVAGLVSLLGMQTLEPVQGHIVGLEAGGDMVRALPYFLGSLCPPTVGDKGAVG